MKGKLDIFALLNAADRNDSGWLSRQPPEVQKDFVPLVAMRWAATLPDGPEAIYMLWLINERVNAHLFDLYKHPDLTYRLMASCGLGAPKRHQWLAGHRTSKTTSNAASRLILQWYPDASDGEVQMLLDQFDRAEFVKFVDDCGIQASDSKEVMHAFDKLYPEKSPKASKGRK